ncbi:MAG: hypothetical protein ACRCTI_18600 [Beijerinckiaceae bacterium]
MGVSATALAAIAASAALGTSFTALADERPDMTPVRLFIPSVAPPACISQLRSIGAWTDFSAFVAADCPADAQRAGLRQLWHLLPQRRDDNPFG